MIPVYQEHFGWGSGDCAWAALASIFEEPLESFEYDNGRLEALSDGDLKKLTEVRWPHLKFLYLDLARNYRVAEVAGRDRWAYDLPTPDEWWPPTDGYYFGSVHSQKLRAPEDSDWYGMPGLHAVVMKGRTVAHDPNPTNAPYPDPVPITGCGWWVQRG